MPILSQHALNSQICTPKSVDFDWTLQRRKLSGHESTNWSRSWSKLELKLCRLNNVMIVCNKRSRSCPLRPPSTKNSPAISEERLMRRLLEPTIEPSQTSARLICWLRWQKNTTCASLPRSQQWPMMPATTCAHWSQLGSKSVRAGRSSRPTKSEK